jgi:hypothetical protein
LCFGKSGEVFPRQAILTIVAERTEANINTFILIVPLIPGFILKRSMKIKRNGKVKNY